MARRVSFRHSERCFPKSSHPVFSLVAVEESNQGVTTISDAFPAKEELKKIVRHHNQEHVAYEEVHEEVIAREVLLALHIAQTVDHDEEAYPSDGDRENRSERVNEYPCV